MPKPRFAIPWTHVALYAALLAVGTVLLQWLDYQRLVRSNAGLVWDGLLATGFLALGIWLGARLLAKRPPPIEGEGNPQAQAALGISARELAVLHEIAARPFQQGDRGTPACLAEHGEDPCRAPAGEAGGQAAHRRLTAGAGVGADAMNPRFGG